MAEKNLGFEGVFPLLDLNAPQRNLPPSAVEQLFQRRKPLTNLPAGAPSRAQVAMQGVAGEGPTRAMARLRGQNPDAVMQAYDGQRSMDPEQFDRDQLTGQIASFALPLLGGKLNSLRTAAPILTKAQQQAAARMADLRGLPKPNFPAAPGKLGAAWDGVKGIAKTGAAALGLNTGGNLADVLARPLADEQGFTTERLEAAGDKWRAGSPGGAIGEIAGIGVDGLVNGLPIVNPTAGRLPDLVRNPIVNDEIRHTMGGVVGAPLLPPRNAPAAQPQTTQAAGQSQATPPVMDEAAFDRQLQAFARPTLPTVTRGGNVPSEMRTPQPPQSVRQALTESLRGLTIGQALRLAQSEGNPTPPAPLKGMDVYLAQYRDMLMQDYQAIVDNPDLSDEVKQAARVALANSLAQVIQKDEMGIGKRAGYEE